MTNGGFIFNLPPAESACRTQMSVSSRSNSPAEGGFVPPLVRLVRNDGWLSRGTLSFVDRWHRSSCFRTVTTARLASVSREAEAARLGQLFARLSSFHSERCVVLPITTTPRRLRAPQLALDMRNGVAYVALHRIKGNALTVLDSAVHRLSIVRVVVLVLEEDTYALSHRASDRALQRMEHAAKAVHALCVPVVCCTNACEGLASCSISGSRAALPLRLSSTDAQLTLDNSDERALRFACWLAQHSSFGLR